MPDGSSDGVKTFSRVGSGQAEAGTITFTEPGVYSHTMPEVDTGVSGYTCNETTYTMTVTVIEGDGRLQQSTQYAKASGTAVSAMSFTNTYRSPSALALTGDPTPQAPWAMALAALSAAMIATAIWRRGADR